MALIQCPDCQREVSEHAPACPYCGCPIAGGQAATKADTDIGVVLRRERHVSAVGPILMIILGLFLAAAIIGFIFIIVGIVLAVKPRDPQIEKEILYEDKGNGKYLLYDSKGGRSTLSPNEVFSNITIGGSGDVYYSSMYCGKCVYSDIADFKKRYKEFKERNGL